MHATYDPLVKLAKEALPLNEAEWGSDRQIEAENRFFEEVQEYCGEFDEELTDWFLKATLEERLNAALEFARESLGVPTTRYIRFFQFREDALRFRDSKQGQSPAICEARGSFEVSWEANPLKDEA